MGGDLGEFTCGKRWVLREVTRATYDRSRSRPPLSLNGSVAGSPVGLAPPQPATEPRALQEQACSGVQSSFDQRFRHYFRALAALRVSLGTSPGAK